MTDHAQADDADRLHPWLEQALLLSARLLGTGMVYLVQVGCLMAVGWVHYWLHGDREAWIHVALIDHAWISALALFAIGGAAAALGLVAVEPRRAEQARPDAPALFAQAQSAATGTAPDLALTHALLVEAHASGSHEAAYVLANWHTHGIVVERDPGKASELLAEAAKAGVPAALHDLGSAYENGSGIETDHGRAYQSYLRGALFGHAESMRAVSRCLDTGRGVAADPEAAQSWWDAYLAKGGRPGAAPTGAWPWSHAAPSPV